MILVGGYSSPPKHILDCERLRKAHSKLQAVIPVLGSVTPKDNVVSFSISPNTTSYSDVLRENHCKLDLPPYHPLHSSLERQSRVGINHTQATKHIT